MAMTSARPDVSNGRGNAFAGKSGSTGRREGVIVGGCFQVVCLVGTDAGGEAHSEVAVVVVSDL